MIGPSTVESGGFPTKPLGEVAEFLDHRRKPITAKDRETGPIPYYGANGQQDSVAGWLFDEPLVLLAEDGGHFETPERGIAYRIDGKSWVNNHAHVLRAGPSVDTTWLTRVLENYDVTSFITGSTRAKLTKSGAARIPIPVPPIEEQRRIAAVLDAADELRAKRREALAKLDTLSQAIFIDMFGDPVANSHGWLVRPLGEVAVKFSDGPFGSNLKSDHYQDSGVRVVRLQNIHQGKFVDDVAAFISEEHFARLSKHECRPGDVLVATMGDPNLRACIQPDWLDVALNKADCVQIRVDVSLATSEWLCTLLNHPSTEEMAQGLVRGQTRSRISMGRLRELKVPVPPVERQRQFSERNMGVAREVERLRRGRDLLDDLFASLQQRAFRGEL